MILLHLLPALSSSHSRLPLRIRVLKYGAVILLSLAIRFSRSGPGPAFSAPKPLRAQHVQQLCEQLSEVN